MTMLLMGVSTWGILANDGTSSTGDATTPSATGAAKPSASANEQITALKQQMALQQKQIEQMQKALAEQKQLLEQLTKPAPATEQVAQPVQPAQPAKPAVSTERASQPHTTSLGEVASTSPMIPQSQKKVDNSIAPLGAGSVSIGRSAAGGDDTSPLQIRIGDATITPVAFMDFTSIYRNHDTNGSIATNFGNIPYASTSAYAPNLSEFRLSTENSRIGMRVDADVKGAHVIGYMEADFHGNNATSVAAVTNSNTLRERLYWVDLNTGHFEILGGQTWSLLTPGRSGISPLPADIFYSQDVDLNYQAGLVFARVPELRLVWHPTKQVAWAFAIDSPDQYAGGNGGSGTIVLPALLNTSATYQGELDYGSGNTLSTPNVAPDLISKLAFDPNKHIHFELGGIERNFKVYYPGVAATSSAAAIPANTFSAEGGAVFVNASAEIFKGFRLLTNNYWSDGGGRYIYGEAPDLIAHANGSISLVHSGSTVTGFEYTQKKTMIYGYYGGIYIQKNTAYDANGTTLIGYGMEKGASATNAENRAIQEATVGFNQTIWKNPKYGALNFMGQYSYLTRAPWYEQLGKPANASVDMLFFNLRYSLPGSAPTMGK
jgi:uncharacterized coiled-coil protein SlyX